MPDTDECYLCAAIKAQEEDEAKKKYKVQVETFFGSRTFEIDALYFWDGKIHRAVCRDEIGQSYKFKDDEEPIKLIKVSK
jgi:hypothetical protein